MVGFRCSVLTLDYGMAMPWTSSWESSVSSMGSLSTWTSIQHGPSLLSADRHDSSRIHSLWYWFFVKIVHFIYQENKTNFLGTLLTHHHFTSPSILPPSKPLVCVVTAPWSSDEETERLEGGDIYGDGRVWAWDRLRETPTPTTSMEMDVSWLHNLTVRTARTVTPHCANCSHCANCANCSHSANS